MIRVLYSLLAGRRGIWVASRQWLLGMETGDGMSKVGLEGGVKGLKGIRVYRGLRTIDQSKQSSTGGHSWGPSHTSLCVPISTTGTEGTRLGM
jgi:hypothetical protein